MPVILLCHYLDTFIAKKIILLLLNLQFVESRINLGKGQGTNARKVISEVYAFSVLQCTVFGRKSKHKTDVTV